jgi:ATP-binding cassette subfamily B protein
LAEAEFTLGTRVIETVQETVRGAAIIKTFNLNAYMRDRMSEAVHAIEERANNIIRLQALSGPIMETLGGISIGLVALYSGWATIVGGQTPGDFMAFATAFLLAYEPAKRLARLHVTLQASMVGLRFLFGVLDLEPSETEVSGTGELQFKRGIIEFRNVNFEYRPATPVLKDINFYVDKSKKVALVGPSGGGKTTILGLIPRLYDPTSGQVLIDGEDIRGVSSGSLRDHIALVSQDTFLFSGTVRENIALGCRDADSAAVEAAARDAHAHDFIMALPFGYETNVGENGVQLSGGQRQRLAIARALLKRAPIILLDEATSALDSDSERHVQVAMDRLMEGRTIIVIAHRLSTVINADLILVVDRGRIVEQGQHHELLALGGLYERFYRHQFAPQKRDAQVHSLPAVFESYS